MVRSRRTAEQLEIATLEYVDWFNHRRLYEACATSRRRSWRKRSTPTITPHRRRVLNNLSLRTHRGDSDNRRNSPGTGQKYAQDPSEGPRHTTTSAVGNFEHSMPWLLQEVKADLASQDPDRHIDTRSKAAGSAPNCRQADEDGSCDQGHVNSDRVGKESVETGRQGASTNEAHEP